MEPSPARAGRRVTCCAGTVDSLQSCLEDGQTAYVFLRPASATDRGTIDNDAHSLLTVDTFLL
jgi:hypothetical protein